MNSLRLTYFTAILTALFAVPGHAATVVTPGGLGLSGLAVWLDAADPNGDGSALSNNSSLTTWVDKSGSGRSVSTYAGGGPAPTYLTGQQNGLPAVFFSGTTAQLRTLTSLAGNEMSYFLTYNTSNLGFAESNRLLTAGAPGVQNGVGFQSQNPGNGATQDFRVVRESNSTQNSTATAAQGVAATAYAVKTGGTFGDAGNFLTWQLALNGAANSTSPQYGELGTGVYLGNNTPTVSGTTNQMETVLYGRQLNTAERVIVQNYLASKWATTLTAGDRYSGDTSGNGNYDSGVFGLGRVDSSNQLLSVGNSGLIATATSLANNDSWLFAGDKAAVNILTSDNVTEGERWSRVWFVDGTNLGLGEQFSLTLDFSDSGFVGSLPTGPFSLFYVATNAFESDPNADFGILSSSFSVIGDRVTFDLTGSQLADGYYTLGVVPEPSTLTFLGVGGLAFLVFCRRRVS